MSRRGLHITPLQDPRIELLQHKRPPGRQLSKISVKSRRITGQLFKTLYGYLEKWVFSVIKRLDLLIIQMCR